jgi:uncharacterized protein involved in exopolysaccharide biosynthesis
MRIEHGLSATAVRVAYEDQDRFTAQRVLKTVVARSKESGPVEVVEQPSLPEAPVSPNRVLLMVAGLAGGGILAVMRRRPHSPAVSS